MADHGEASHSENLFVVIQDIRETPVHLVVFTGTGRIAAPAVALRCDLLSLGGDESLWEAMYRFTVLGFLKSQLLAVVPDKQ